MAPEVVGASRFIRDAGLPSGIVVNDAHIHWRDIDTGGIGRTRLDGGHVNESFITGASDQPGCGQPSATRTELAERT